MHNTNIGKNYLKIIELNTCSLISHKKRHIMQSFLTANNPDIVLICETNLSNSHVINFRNYDFIRKNKMPGTFDRGSGILIKSTIDHQPIDTRCWGLQSLECTATKVNSTGRPLTVVSAYRNVTDRTNVQFVDDLYKICSILNRSGPLVIGGDFNARHPFWRDAKTSTHGKLLYDWYIDNSLQLGIKLESSYEPTHYIGNARSYIDFFIISDSINVIYAQSANNTLEICDFESDHRGVQLPILLNGRTVPRDPKTFLDYNATNWNRLRKQVENGMNSINIASDRNMTTAEMDKAVEEISHLITDAIDKEVPKRTVNCNTIISLPQDLIHLIHHKKRLRRQWQRVKYCHNTHLLKSEINNISKIINDRIKQVHTDHYTKALQSVKVDNNMFKHINRLTARQKKPPICSLKSGDKLVVNEAEKAELLAEHFEAVHKNNCNLGNPTFNAKVETTVRSVFHTPAIPRTIFSTDIPANPIHQFNQRHHIVSINNLHAIVKSRANKKSSGHDNIPNVILRKLGRHFIAKLATLFNQLYNVGHFPPVWKLARSVAVFKHGKPRDNTNSYRPIALLPCIGKIFECVVQQELVSITDELNILPDEQFGFRRSRSTLHALTKLQTDVSENLNQKRPTMAVALDVAKAFDTTWINGLVFKLYNIYQINIQMCRTIFNYLTERRFQVSVGQSLSTIRPIAAGVPQGGVLSATLYVLYTADLPPPPHHRHQIKRLQYADDILVYVNSPLLFDAKNRLEVHIREIVDFLQKWKLKCNEDKSELIIIKAPNRLSHPAVNRACRNISMQIGGNTVHPTKTIRYLGVIFEKKNQHIQHINHAVRKANLALILIRPILKKVIGLSKDVKLLCYKQLIRPILTYGFPSWANISSAQMERLRIAERKCIRACVNYRRETGSYLFCSNTKLYRQANINRIDRHLIELGQKFFRRITELDNSSAIAATTTNITINTLSPYKPPWLIMNNEIIFNTNGQLIYYHRRRNVGRNPTVYKIGQ